LHVVPEPAMSANIPCVEEDYSGSIRGRSDINRHHAPCREESDTCVGCWQLRQALASLRRRGSQPRLAHARKPQAQWPRTVEQVFFSTERVSEEFRCDPASSVRAEARR
jgi:hypothetical protein